MSGMAGNVTAFNTSGLMTFAKSYIAPNKSDNHYLWMAGWLPSSARWSSMGAAFVAAKFGNIMDYLQLCSPLSTPPCSPLMLGMFWATSYRQRRFLRMLSGTLAAALHHV